MFQLGGRSAEREYAMHLPTFFSASPVGRGIPLPAQLFRVAGHLTCHLQQCQPSKQCANVQRRLEDGGGPDSTIFLLGPMANSAVAKLPPPHMLFRTRCLNKCLETIKAWTLNELYCGIASLNFKTSATAITSTSGTSQLPLLPQHFPSIGCFNFQLPKQRLKPRHGFPLMLRWPGVRKMKTP